MNSWWFACRKLIGGIPLLFGVTLISFTLMVYFGPDLTYELLGKNPTATAIAEVRHSLGYDQPFWHRYLMYVQQLITLDFGLSMVKDQPVTELLQGAIPVSIQLLLPGFIIGNILAILLAMKAVQNRGKWPDKTIMTFSVIGMSVSFLVIIIGCQLIFSSSYGLDLFPVRGWQVHDKNEQFSWLAYLNYVTVPTIALVLISLGYNTRFYRAVLADEVNKDHINTARAFGHSDQKIYYQLLLKNTMVPIITRTLFSIPMVIISGSLLLESYFGIPGVGLITYEAIIAGDQPVLKAIVGLTAVLFVLVLIGAEILYRLFDPRMGATQK
ncbi:ABC transporter permease [Marinicella sp. S1101]|uniref:ABC transporter permease n=1 Tax=Marinicella marina TaxID=2996016 RepID=UPI002260AD8F|nr:ABC transporter permease [Marinicella marina]MCX7552978.1 ABC transporter permease [Marinicella marina]MDJ1139712.1 ABC transporter permease [Marinicella marina]